MYCYALILQDTQESSRTAESDAIMLKSLLIALSQILIENYPTVQDRSVTPSLEGLALIYSIVRDSLNT